MNISPNQLFYPQILELDAETSCRQIADKLHRDILKVLRRRGAVIGISGGIDSSVTLALTVRALGAKRVLGIIMPEKDSNPQSAGLAQQLADRFGVQTVTEDMTGILNSYGCYRRRDEAISRLFPEYKPATHKVKIALPQNLLEQDTLNYFSATIIAPDGSEKSKRLPPKEYLQIVAASNFKQRSRMSMLYYHAEARHYAVIGTPNKHEHAQGFFVKYGDGGADVMPIAHLYKTQVYQLARYLDVPEEIIARPPTSDTYSAECTQQEFFFQLPFELMDLLWYAFENQIDVDKVAPSLDLSSEQVERAFAGFRSKQRTTEYLRLSPIRS